MCLGVHYSMRPYQLRPPLAVWGNVLADKKSSSYELRVGASTVFCLEIDEEWRVFCAVVTAAYPSRHIFSGSSDQRE